MLPRRLPFPLIVEHIMSIEHDTWVECARAVHIEDELARRGINVSGKTERDGPCPKCGGNDRFAINVKKQVFNCRGCKAGGDVIDFVQWLDGVGFIEACTTLAGPPPKNGKDHTAGEPKKMCTAKYPPYTDEAGAVLFHVERYEYRYPDGSFVINKDDKRKKTFIQKRPDPNKPGECIYNVDGVRIVPYRLPELTEAIANDQFIVIVEGEAKVEFLRTWNIPATCNAMGAGKWKPEHSEFLRGADVVIVPDNDEAGRNHAELIGASLQGIAKSVRVLDLRDIGPRQDIIDWAKRGGTVEQLHDLIAREARPWTARARTDQQTADEARQQTDDETERRTKDGDPRLYPFEMFDDIADDKQPAEIVPGILPMGPGLGVFYGPPKSLKSLIVNDLMLHVAANILFCGREVMSGACIYITSEGVSGARRRLVASRKALGVEGKKIPFVFIPAMPNLGKTEADRDTLIRTVNAILLKLGQPLRIVTIDTLRRALPGQSENKPEDMSALINNCEALAKEFGCLVILIHHSPRSDDRRSSGLNSLDAAADIMVCVGREDMRPYATAEVMRYKDGEEGVTWEVELEVEQVGTDHSGKPKTGAYVTVIADPKREAADTRERTATAKVLRKKLGDKQRRALDCLDECLLSGQTVEPPRPRAPPSITKAVKADDWRTEMERSGALGDDANPRRTFGRIKNTLARRMLIGEYDGLVWRAY